MKTTDQEKAQQLCEIKYVSKSLHDFQKAVRLLFARQDAKPNLFTYKVNTRYEEGTRYKTKCGHEGSVVMLATYKNRTIHGEICKICGV